VHPRYSPENYRIVVHSKTLNGTVYITAVNFDFGVEHHEQITRFSESEKILSMAQLVIGIQKKISDHLRRLDRNQLPHPVPMNTEEVLKPKLPESLSIGEVARLLGERIHNVRRMADQGLLPLQLSQGGHRRFPKDMILKIVGERFNPSPTSA